MTGGTRNHGRMQRNILLALTRRLNGGDCEALGSDVGITTIGGAMRYLDALVTCTKRPGTERLIPGVVVFEVLSPTSGRNDRIDKLREYRAVTSILCSVILEYAGAGLTAFRRASGTEGWTAAALLTDGVLQMPEIGIRVPVAEFYAGVNLTDPEPEA